MSCFIDHRSERMDVATPVDDAQQAGAGGQLMRCGQHRGRWRDVHMVARRKASEIAVGCESSARKLRIGEVIVIVCRQRRSAAGWHGMQQGERACDRTWILHFDRHLTAIV